MTDQALAGLRRLFVETEPRFALVATAAFCLAAGLVVGAYVAILSPIYAVAGIVALTGSIFMLRDTQWGFLALIGLICLLPFAALPVSIGFTPTFLDFALLALYFVWAARIVTGRADRFIATALGLPLAVFLLLAVASFVIGLTHAHLSSYVSSVTLSSSC
jgi:polysaccharide biosynthesis protein PslJ